jgi:hypothetical protein
MGNQELETFKVCHFCGIDIKDEKKIKFCCEEHGRSFSRAKKANKKIKIKVDNKTTIFTDKYDKISDIILKYRNMMDDYTRYAPGGPSSLVKIGSNHMSGDMR